MTKSESKKLRASLPSNYATIISEELGKHPGFISQVARGVKINPEILSRLIELAEETKNAEKVNKQLIKNL